MREGREEWDVFISYASEDKETIARPLADALSALGVETWWDTYEILPGDSIRKSIDHGIEQSRCGIIVLSVSFFAKGWTEYEMSGLVHQAVAKEKRLIPIWHGIASTEVMKYSPSLADRAALNTATQSINKIAQDIAQIIRGSEPQAKRNVGQPLTMKKPYGTSIMGAPGRHYAQEATDLEIEDFIEKTLTRIREYFETSLSNMEKANPGWQGKIRSMANDAFEATIYDRGGNRRSHCGIFLSSAMFLMPRTITYSTNGVGSRNIINEQLSLAQGPHGQVLAWDAWLFGGQERKPMNETEAAEYLWQKFTEHLE